MDSNVRWEYCNVPLCSESVASASDDENNLVVIAVIIVVPLLLLMLLLLIFIVWRVMKRKQTKSLYKSEKINENTYKRMSFPNRYVLDPTMAGFDKLPNIPREKITYISDLGEGNFGMVVKGEAKNIVPGQFSTLVAVKVLKEGSSNDASSGFVREAVLMNQFDHPNILKLLGVCFEQEPFCIIFEYMELGDLNKYLRSKAVNLGLPSSSLTMQQLVDMAINIAAGLEYLAGCHFVHRDLATRNCLINHQLFVKISDFGLSKDIYSKDYYRLGDKSVLPIRWMPPEAIVFAKFTTQSDIWSFGIVLWEIFSGGAQPYYTLSNEEVMKYVTDEKVLRCPSSCPSEIYDLMVDCWAVNPDDRPTASEVHNGLQNWSPQLSANNATTVHVPHVDSYVQMSSARSSNNGSIQQNYVHETFM